jgi:hypothetical protein
VRRADNFTTFMCQLSWNLRVWTSWNPQGLSRPVMRLLYLLFKMNTFHTMKYTFSILYAHRTWSNFVLRSGGNFIKFSDLHYALFTLHVNRCSIWKYKTNKICKETLWLAYLSNIRHERFKRDHNESFLNSPNLMHFRAVGILVSFAYFYDRLWR